LSADSGVVTISGVAAAGDSKLTTARFSPAGGTSPAQAHIFLINAAGFDVGEFVTIRFDLAAGSGFPAGKDAFTVSSFSAKGMNGLPLSNLIAVPISLSAI
jgi:hypothetical protein